MITLYGIKSCDTCRKALKWLAAEGLDHSYHDLRADGLEEALVADWLAALGWEKLLNKSSTTWRQLDPADKEGLDDSKALTLLMAHPTLIKRPVFVRPGKVPLVGFRDAQKAELKG
ncbi:arsenate reductase [Rhodovibrionaceae bacterium A322]